MSSAVRCQRALGEQSPILLGQNIATTLRRTTATGKVAIPGQIILIAIIAGQFLSVADRPKRYNPERSRRLFDGTIGIAGVVDIAGGVPEDLAINIVAVIEGKNIRIALGQAPGAFVFGNLLADVGKNPGPVFDVLRGKEPEACNTRFMHPDTYFHRSPASFLGFSMVAASLYAGGT